MQEESEISQFSFLYSIPNIIILGLFISAIFTIIWVAQIAWNDIVVWNKDIETIFFGSRTGENISLGIGMQLIHYLFVGISLLGVGFIFLLRNKISVTSSQQKNPIKTQKIEIKNPIKISNNITESNLIESNNDKNDLVTEERFFSGCLHHFGYLSSRPKDSPIPPECIICQRLGDCMVATVYVKKGQ
jgi:hypothetical protein